MSRLGEKYRLEPGHHLDRYELLCPIARGGMAWVWLACLHGKAGFEKLVAVKTILPQYATDRRFQRMFLDEARIAAGITHANVARILDLGESRGVLYLVMEWVDGDSLAKLQRAVRSRDESMPIDVVLRIMADVSAGLHAAHELRGPSGAPLGVVHRDVSPQNILVSVNGITKVIDFGIVTVRDRALDDFHAGLLKGKFPFMSPEQAVGKPVDRRSDVWAMGAVTYYLLTGNAPYGDDNEFATLRKLRSGAPPPSLPPMYPSELDALCKKAMARDPEERMATAAEFQFSVETLMVRMGCHRVSSDLAAFVGHHLGDRRDARYKAIAHAVRVAADRRCQVLLSQSMTEALHVDELEAQEDDETRMFIPRRRPRTAARAVCVLAPSCGEPLRAAALGVAVALSFAGLIALLRILFLTVAGVVSH
ncbi:serine/threonine protein kinase [Pendulispora brunnea]|uniref:Serine/threonine protein kinase n=1 Tax=Pendulispora brunnea TaxID=2905690 RepID=A0ABZ2KM29_9BACT